MLNPTGSSNTKNIPSSLVPFCPPSLSVEEAEKRIRDAEELEEKLKEVQESVPTRVYNVCGSAAGAGSGDFHQYRMIRRREQMRLRRIEDEAGRLQHQLVFESQRDKRKIEDEEKTAKRRAKRQKRKERKKAKKRGGAVQMSAEASEGCDGEELTIEEEQPQQVALD